MPNPEAIMLIAFKGSGAKKKNDDEAAHDAIVSNRVVSHPYNMAVHMQNPWI